MYIRTEREKQELVETFYHSIRILGTFLKKLNR
jgi:hypothetical protein